MVAGCAVTQRVRIQKGQAPAKNNFERGKIGQQKAWDFNSHLGLGKQRSATTPTFTLLANKYILAKEFRHDNLVI